ncbi:hypothetical protein TEA_010854 [Camellia sinensis var. sinensis]|uniref:PLAC8 motif-containing protein n=1 Tax=Camellia sinensis var. sinensis TaxID=542762 RepID=A0A4S4EQE9_CAMSN|nr:hypothetical protein TEA_010854 [Camellia sinensis var. sinensis]
MGNSDSSFNLIHILNMSLISGLRSLIVPCSSTKFQLIVLTSVGVSALQDSPCDPCMVHCCLHWCAVCQEHREMKGHLTDNTAAIETIVNPPPVQEMNAANQTKESPSSSENGTGHTNLELQPI